jgi:hypothetical protein
VNEGIEKGRFKPIDSEKIGRLFYFTVMGAFFTFFSVDPDFDFSNQLSFQTGFLLKAL